ncbi:MAG: hypothetical protein P4M11_03565 [Candidatus Pacebacteria bacterium]|nr:hypothetical protein [Candidatus Paceibacterota bacterium]
MDSPNPETSFFPYNCISLSPNPLLITPPATPPHFDLSDPSPLRFTCDPPEAASPLPVAPPSKKPSQEPENNPQKHRGRKRTLITAEQKQEASAKRVERNRFFARENRRKKKAYTHELEQRIVVLTGELNFCKRKVAEYEAKERERYTNFQDFYRQVKNSLQRFEEQRVMSLSSIIQRSVHNIDGLMQALRSSLAEKRRVLDTMSETFVEFSVSRPYRHVMYMIEHGHEIAAASEKDPEESLETPSGMSKTRGRIHKF